MSASRSTEKGGSCCCCCCCCCWASDATACWGGMERTRSAAGVAGETTGWRRLRSSESMERDLLFAIGLPWTPSSSIRLPWLIVRRRSTSAFSLFCVRFCACEGSGGDGPLTSEARGCGRVGRVQGADSGPQWGCGRTGEGRAWDRDSARPRNAGRGRRSRYFFARVVAVFLLSSCFVAPANRGGHKRRSKHAKEQRSKATSTTPRHTTPGRDQIITTSTTSRHTTPG